MRRKRISPLPEAFGQSEHDRFTRFAKAILAVPKSEIMPAGEVLAKLQAEKQKVDSELAEVRREIARRRKSQPKS